ncbi:MAG: phosphoenolpyruvate phosphomutase [Chloroflexi bacterium]|nr:phosphoenolpyruvate phosphomutase [Chloroflexota bacterium]
METTPAARLRALLQGLRVAQGVGAGDALTARLIERAGFDFVWASGFCMSAAAALPDASLITMGDVLEATRRMVEAVQIPVLADCDTGFGNAVNVIHTVQRFERAGAAGICLEDKQFPKDTSLLEGGRQHLAPAAEFAGKVRAAKDAQRAGDFVVVARVEALIAGWGHEEALARAEQYAEAGADAVLIHSKARTPDEIVAFARHWDGRAPLVLVPTNYPSLTAASAAELGHVRLLIYANQPLRAAVQSQEHLLAEIRRAGGVHTVGDLLCPVPHIFELQGVPQMKEQERRYS